MVALVVFRAARSSSRSPPAGRSSAASIGRQPEYLADKNIIVTLSQRYVSGRAQSDPA
jgi:hypothetical protein